uniref:DUF302 domain-containing protein n=1 Tax=Candidatus Nitrotoga fabula TaxID=2182327 RepID=A0A2X0QWR1_9PROT|nr:conserved protein of unknown function [Candidatus Nitrotoga fabula]
MTKYGFGKTVDMSFDDAIAHVTQALQGEGFGILADIDVAATMKKKLNQDMPPYRILGACNPPLAHRALESEPTIGLLLPCNVVVRQDEAGAVHVEFMDPNAVLELVNKPEITALASEVRQRLERVSAALGGSEEARSAQTDEAMAKVDTRQIQASMEKIQQAQDPQEQQRLMREHMQQMRETMRSMGGEMHGKCMCCGH